MRTPGLANLLVVAIFVLLLPDSQAVVLPAILVLGLVGFFGDYLEFINRRTHEYACAPEGYSDEDPLRGLVPKFALVDPTEPILAVSKLRLTQVNLGGQRTTQND